MSGLAPVVAAATASAAIVPGSGIVRAEVGTAHVAIAGAVLGGLGRGYDTAFVPAAVQEVMRQFLAGHDAGAHGQAGREAAGDAGAYAASAHGRLTIARAISAGCAAHAGAAHAGARTRTRRRVLVIGSSPAEQHQENTRDHRKDQYRAPGEVRSRSR